MEDKKSHLGDILKKVVDTGKEMGIGNVVDQIKSSKDDFVGSVKAEVKNYLDKIDISKELDRVLENYDFEVKATISAKKKTKKKTEE
jgi:hypothetical protein